MILHHFTPRQSAISYHRLRMVLAKAILLVTLNKNFYMPQFGQSIEADIMLCLI